MKKIIPDQSLIIQNIPFYRYNLQQHNFRNIEMPHRKMIEILGITIHNQTYKIKNCREAIIETILGNMGDERYHFYVDNKEIWQLLSVNQISWHTHGGDINGNHKTISILCIMENKNDKQAENNCIKLISALIQKLNLPIGNIYTHSYWYNIQKEKKDLLFLNTYNATCPQFILPHWEKFINKVKKEVKNKYNYSDIYFIRKKWNDVNSQIGEYNDFEVAKNNCINNYAVFDNQGNILYNKYRKPEYIIINQEQIINQIKVEYKTYCNNQWKETINYNVLNENGYGGIKNFNIKGISIVSKDLNIKYRGHIWHGIWTNFNKKNGQIIGDKRQSFDIFQIYIENNEKYDILYRVSNKGDFGEWVKNGKPAGIEGQPIERIQIQIKYRNVNN